MFLTIVSYVGAVAAGVVLALKVIAPKTKTLLDDKILGYVEDLEKIIEALGGQTAVAKLPEKPEALKA